MALRAIACPSSQSDDAHHATWMRDGSMYVCVVTGMPEQAVRIGVGDSADEAWKSLQATPIQSIGRDGGVSAAISWATGAGWF